MSEAPTGGIDREPPPIVPRITIGITTFGYLVVAGYDQWFRDATFLQRGSEWLAAVALVVAFVVSLRSARQGAIVAIGAVGLELLSSVALEEGDPSVKIVVPTLIAAAGLMLGERAAALSGFVFGGGAVVVELLLSPPFTTWPPNKARPLVVLAIVAAAATVLTRAAVRAQGRALEASDRSRRRFLDLFQNAPEGLVALDADGVVLDANRRAVDLLGTEDLPGRSLAALLGEEAVPLGRPLVEGTTESPVRVELGEGAAARTLEVTGRPVDPRVSEGRAWMLELRDTTERRALEERLLHAQRLETVGLLAGGVAHDFNNLLTVVGGNAELLALDAQGEAGELAREILDAQRRGTALTRQLLAFARRDVRRPERLDLAETVRGMERLLARLLGERNRLELRTAGEVPVVADRSHLEQVAVNLVTNARDASPPDAAIRVEVYVAAAAEVASRVPAAGEGAGAGMAALAVSDRGQGMSAETRARIFEPFFTTKARGQGTGLGLSTVHGIVAQSGGALEVDTSPGRGTRITVYLPLASAAVAAGEPRPESPRAQGGKGRVIVVEDDPGVRTLVVRTLLGAGYEVDGYSGGREALEALVAGGEAPGLLLTDMAMPELDGPEVVNRARAIRPGLPVLFMTGYFDEGRITRPDVLRKPFSPEELLRSVAKALGAPEAAQPP